MLRRSLKGLFLMKIRAVSKPPVSGYEIVELPNEKVLKEFMAFHKSKGILAIFHSGITSLPKKQETGLRNSAATVSGPDSRVTTSTVTAPTATAGAKAGRGASPSHDRNARKPSTVADDPLIRTFVSSLNAMNFGHPDEVKIALVPGPQAPRTVEEFNIITYPTTLLFLDGQCAYRVVGARTKELSIKSLFMLRNAGRNIISRQ